MTDPETAPEPEGPSKEELRLAMKAFRKRLKLMKLDEESSLGHGPMSSGRKSSIAAIRPPDQFPKAVCVPTPALNFILIGRQLTCVVRGLKRVEWLHLSAG